MRFLVDECTGPGVANWLRSQGHDVYSIYEQARGAEDDAVISLARREKRILITNDKGFGELVFRDKLPHFGVILIRLDDETLPNKVKAIEKVLQQYPGILENHFIVVSETRVRISKA